MTIDPGTTKFPDDADKWDPPDGHEKISNRTLGFLTVTPNGELFWKGSHVEVKQKSTIVFGFFSGLLAILVAVSTVLIGALNFNQEFCFLPFGNSCQPAPEPADLCSVVLGKDGTLSARCPSPEAVN